MLSFVASEDSHSKRSASGQGSGFPTESSFCPKGYSGLPGVVGQPGVSGPKGRKGSTGYRGPKGVMNLNLPHVHICSMTDTIGLQGRKGESGSQGNPGYPGAPSQPGSRGSPGLKGRIGQPGSPGLPGRCIYGPVGKYLARGIEHRLSQQLCVVLAIHWLNS